MSETDQHYDNISAQRLMEVIVYADKMKGVCDDDPTNTSNNAGNMFYDIYRALIELSVRRKLMGSKESW